MIDAMTALANGGLLLAFPGEGGEGRAAPPLLAPPRLMARGGLAGLRRGLAAAAGLLPCPALGELERKASVFDRFRHPLAALGSAAPASFAGRVAAARRLPPASGLWVLEGLGDAAADGDEPLHRRLEREGVAIASWPPLHAGLGLALARRFLSALPPAPRDVAAAVAGFARRCRRQAAPGYAGAVFESLGFVAWNLHPRHLAALDRALAEDDPVRRRYLWHGVGRGLYFSPLCAVPGGTAVALARAALAPPFAAGRRNAVAGVAWALTLVNLPRPESFAAAAAVAAPYLDRELAAAFGDGVASALALWHRVYGEEPTAGRFLAAAAASSAGRRLACRPWERLRRRRRGREGAVEELFIHP